MATHRRVRKAMRKYVNDCLRSIIGWTIMILGMISTRLMRFRMLGYSRESGAAETKVRNHSGYARVAVRPASCRSRFRARQ